MADERQLVKSEVLAKFCELQLRQIQTLTQQGVITAEKIPGQVGNRYDFLTSVRALLKHYRSRADTKYKSSSPELESAKLTGQNIDNEHRALKLALDKKDAHRSDDIIEVFTSLVTRQRVALSGIAMAIAPEDKQMRDLIDGYINRALQELSSFDINDFAKHGGATYIAKLEQESGVKEIDSDDED